MYSGVIINSIIRTVVSEMTRDSYEFVKKQVCGLVEKKRKAKSGDRFVEAVIDEITGV